MALENFRADFGNSAFKLSREQENITISEKLGENVMPLEIAIKRELAYRMRVEKLQAEPRVDIKEASARSQGPPPIPSTSLGGKKRKKMSSNLQLFQTRQPRPSYGRQSLQDDSSKLFCDLCQVACSSKSSLKQHRQESKHKAKLEKQVESQKSSREKNSRQQWCKLCRISCSDENAFTQHLAGKKHAASVHAIEAAKRIREDVQKEALKVKWDELQWDMVA